MRHMSAFNQIEQAVLRAMQSEHCSYLSSKIYIDKLHTKNKNILGSIGQNAGVIDLGDNDAVAFKIESHNHPSFIEPYQGAATGVGGIVRDIFTMGFRPIALANHLFFGNPASERNNRLIHGVVAGLSDYGNCIGVPTVSTKAGYANCYELNPLVNAMCVGYSNGQVVTNQSVTPYGEVYYVGATTGSDGIGGAEMSSESFTGETDLRPTVQVGDPYMEKLLIEAMLELVGKTEVLAAQDMGAAGLTSAASELGRFHGGGIHIHLDDIPLREELTPEQILLSESQERMLIVLPERKFGRDNTAFEIFSKYGLNCVKIGKLIKNSEFRVSYKNEMICAIPNRYLKTTAIERPTEERETSVYEPYIEIDSSEYNYEHLATQFDSQVQGRTIRIADEDDPIAIVKLPNSNKGLAIMTAGYPHLVYSNPGDGVAKTVAMILTAFAKYGIQPVAFTNCMNFGSPENPFVMNDFKEVMETFNDHAMFYDIPIISGNVSFYNETNEQPIMPTPVIGAVGLIEDVYV